MAARSKQEQKRRPNARRGLKADCRGASPEQVAEALLRLRAQPGMKSKRFVNPSTK